MSEPVVDLNTVVPHKWKPIIGLLGSLLAVVIPAVVAAETSLPPVWTVVIGAGVALLTALGIYKAPYQPEGTIIAPATPEVIESAQAAMGIPKTPLPEEETPAPAPPSKRTKSGEYQNPWKT